MRVTHPVNMRGVEQGKAERSLNLGQGLKECFTEATALREVRCVGLSDELCHGVGVGQPDAGQCTKLRSQILGVGQVPVMRQGESNVAHRAKDRLGASPISRASRGVPRVSNRRVTREALQGAIIKD